MSKASVKAWREALDLFEVHLNEAQRLVATREPAPVTPWVEPKVEGPIPAELLGRAHSLFERHSALMEALPQALVDAQQGQKVTKKMADAFGQSKPQPIYINQEA